MAMNAEHMSKFAALDWLWKRLHMSEKFSSGTNKKTKSRDKKWNVPNCTKQDGLEILVLINQS